MKILLILLVGIALGFLASWFWKKNRNNNQGIVKERLEQKEENLKKILEYIQEKTCLPAGREKVTNDEIEELLNVSHATAFRYLEELEKEGTIKQVGKSGSGVYYQKI